MTALFVLSRIDGKDNAPSSYVASDLTQRHLQSTIKNNTLFGACCVCSNVVIEKLTC